jgi:hypothetical protein
MGVNSIGDLRTQIAVEADCAHRYAEDLRCALKHAEEYSDYPSRYGAVSGIAEHVRDRLEISATRLLKLYEMLQSLEPDIQLYELEPIEEELGPHCFRCRKVVEYDDGEWVAWGKGEQLACSRCAAESEDVA